MFLLNDSSVVISGSCRENKGYIARIGGVGNPMHPDPRPAPYIAPPEPVYTIPNLITPNNDGLNETFEILSNKILATGVQLKIYNRWGSQIYTSKNYQHNWAAEGLPDGVYYYQAEVKDKKYKGWVQVVR
jgi:gliding motility-associated-like protein